MAEINLIDSVRRWVMSTLPYEESDTDIIQALDAKDIRSLLIVYHNWMSRLIRPTPRRVKKSRFFEINAHRANFTVALTEIEADIIAGRDLTKYLSKGVRVALKLPSRHIGAFDLDLLLNDWGVHHLHISTELGTDGFVARTGPLLFVRFVEDTAFFLDIADHGQWTKASVVDALVNEFPDAGGLHPLNGFTVSKPFNESEHQKLRSKHVNSLMKIGDKAVAGGGISLAGKSIMAVREADRLLSSLEKFEKNWIENEQEIRTKLKEQGIDFPVEPSFEFEIHEDGPMIVEAKTQTALKFM